MPPPPLLPYEYGCTYHRLGFIEVRLQYHHVEHIYRHCQCILYPIMVLPQYPSIICIEDTGSLHRRLSHAMLRLLWDAYHLQYRLHHRIHHNVKNYGGCGVTPCGVLHALCNTDRHPSNRHFNSCNTLGKDTTYVVGTPPTSSTPLIWGTQTTWICAICVLSYEAATVTPHSLKLTRVFFRSLKVSPSSVDRR